MYVETSLHPAYHILPMKINKLCVGPIRIWSSMDVSGSCVNSNLHSSVEIMLPPFWSPTVIGGGC